MADMGRFAVASVLGMGLVVACGGRTLEEPFSDSNTTGSLLPDGGLASTSPPSGGSGNPNATDRFGSSVQLPECKLGFDPAKFPGNACPFVTSGRCYTTKLAACACACPNRSGTSCASGFPDERDRVLVTCS
jgi:hypothetical protein